MKVILSSIGVFLVVVFVYYISVYNRLTRLNNAVLEARSGIDIALLKRFDLITDLIEVTKGYMHYEESQLVHLAKLRSEYKEQPDNVNDALNEWVSTININIEKYPDLKASDQFLNLQKNMSNVEEHLQAARRFYNKNVVVYNNTVEEFPSNIIAKQRHFIKHSLFETKITHLEKPIVDY